MVDRSQDILEYVKKNGPSLPLQLAKEIGSESYIASAYLSSLSSRGEIKISHLKVGGSPLYYVPGQEALLQNFSDKLNGPDRRVYELLKTKKVLRDKMLEPVQRVGLRGLKDFAIMLNVKLDEGVEVFWKWYLLSDGEAEAEIKKLLNIVDARPEQKPAAAAKPVAQPIPQPAPVAQPIAHKAEEKAAEPQTAKPKAEPKEAPKEEPKAEPKPAAEPKLATETKQVAEQRQAPPAKARPKAEAKERPKIEPKAEEKKQEKLKGFIEQAAETLQQTFAPVSGQEDAFLEEVRGYFSKSGITITEYTIIKKAAELDLVIELPSPVGRLTYFCKAKAKKKSNEGDLASAFIQAQARKLPCLYLTHGDITKRAAEMLNREFKGMAVKIF